MEHGFKEIPNNTPLPFFVYGTLRKDCDLHPHLAPFILKGPFKATIKATLAKASAGPWPVLIDRPGLTHGELYILNSMPELLNILITEEIAYGYSLRWEFFETPDFTGLALLCFWPHQNGFTTIIEHGDWVKYLSQLNNPLKSLKPSDF